MSMTLHRSTCGDYFALTSHDQWLLSRFKAVIDETLSFTKKLTNCRAPYKLAQKHDICMAWYHWYASFSDKSMDGCMDQAREEIPLVIYYVYV